ncbi:uncharacterized protein LOC5514667 [Nematostella vectensis]|uniref:uncharacterized protein LOC5514667 n=1 Tax=Nematostella vectensis TaxID=45351 RepID=UPI0020775060|nr:uncharacterized protein LOC5514667 [Nematostella vectensis]
MDLEELARYWARFHISFSWDYPDGFDLQAVQKAVFHVVSETDASSQEQLVVGCVQSAGAGVILTRPRPETDVVPCEMSFTAHPMSDEFSIKSVVIVSEARNVELYVDGSYAKTAKGIMLTIRKGRKVSLLETEFDLSEYVHSKCKCLVKFLSFPNAHALRLQTIVVKIAKTPPAGPAAIPQDIIPGTIDFASVKDYINSSGKELTPEAQKLLASMEQMQMAQALSTQAVQMRHPRPRSSSVDARRKGLQEQEGEHSRTSVASDGLLHQAMIKAREMEEEEMINRMDHRSSPDESDGLVNMLAGLMNSKGNHDIPSIPNGHLTSNEDSDPQALAQARWEAYLQSRVRAGQSITDNSRPGSYAFSTSTPSLLTSLQGPTSVIDHAALDNTRDHSHPLILNGTGKTNKVNSAPELHGANTRCAACGCPGCIAVYNSIATNIYAAEERIMARVDEKMQQILQHIDARFEKLGQSTLQRQEQFPSPGGYSGPGNHRRSKPSKSVGDTSV